MKWTKKTLNNLFFFCGVAAVVIMLFTFDVSFYELWQHLCRAGYWLIPIIGVWVIIYGINALAWQCTIKGSISEGEHVSFLRIYKLTIIGYALNYATPVGGLGGEPYRIMALSRDISKEHASSSVILYAMMHIFAHFWLWFTSIFFYLGLVLIGDLPFNNTVATIFGLIAVLFAVFLYLFIKGFRHGLVVNMMKLLGKIPGLKKWSARMLTEHGDTFRNIDTQIAALHKKDKKLFYSSLLLEYVSRIVQSLEVMFMLLLFGIDCGGGLEGLSLTFVHSILIVAFTTFFANLIGFLPMQLGVQEGGFAISIYALGLSAALGIFVSIICRVREILWIIAGVLLMKTEKDSN